MAEHSLPMFAVRHKVHARYMPFIKAGKGYSHWEPADEVTEQPRLFYTKKSAQNAISAWCQGKAESRTVHSNSYFDPESYDVIDIVKVPGRRKEDLEVISLTLLGLS